MSLVDGTPLTYGALNRAVQQRACRLYSLGVREGDHVALIGSSSPDWVISYFGIICVGAVVVPILPDFTGEAVNNILEHSESRVLISDEKLFQKLDHASMPDLLAVVSLTGDYLVAPAALPGNLEHYPRPRLSESDLAAIVYTSGTTGLSKGVMLTHRNIVSNALAGNSIVQVESSDVFLSILPLAHTYECTFGMIFALHNGASIYYLGRRPTASILLPALAKIRPTYMLSVPLVIEKIFKLQIQPKLEAHAATRFLMKLPPLRVLLHRMAGKKLYGVFGGKLKFFGIGGAPLAPDVERFLRDARFPYAIGYGLTETSPLIAGCCPRLTRYRSTGPAIEGVEVKIDNSVPGLSHGEIWVKGPNVMRGYFKNKEATDNVFTEDGWFRTGDLGEFSACGYLYIKGRLKNMLLGPSGENIYPEEIEALLARFPSVLESVVVQNLGKLVARVHLNRDELLRRYQLLKEKEKAFEDYVQEHLEDIRRKANQSLATFSRLQLIIEQMEPFEKTPTNKIKRFIYASA
ncbi:MAG: AMP-binding protein [Opitutales bacterium]|nr:AMP-binding protein [Opitutales bacterium]